MWVIRLQNIKAQQKFIAFIKSSYKLDSLPTENSHIYVNTHAYKYTNEEGYIGYNIGNLDYVLKKIYNVRSQYLHNGEPMHISQPLKIPNDWDMDASLGGRKDNRNLDSPLPYPRWFENVVRDCLLNYLASTSFAKR